MAEERRQVREGRFKRQGTSLRESARYELEGSPARRRLPARLFLCEDGRDEKEANECKDSQRSGFTHQESFEGMELLDLNTAWSAVLSLVMGLLGYMMNEKFRELARITILLNKTREEVARDNVTQAEVDRITNHIDQRFNKLEAKIDQLIQKG